jgi:hypothetical protein
VFNLVVVIVQPTAIPSELLVTLVRISMAVHGLVVVVLVLGVVVPAAAMVVV